MKNYGWTFGWILGLVAASCLAIYAYGLKLGIDLSGGTILVYEVKEGTKTTPEMMDSLIGSLKHRINPEGLVDLPIRKVANGRVEIILAEATPEEVDLLKRKITDVGSLEFRILANYKHDQTAINRIERQTNLEQLFRQPPSGYRWVRLGEVISGGKDVDGKEVPGAAGPVAVSSTEVRLPGRDLPRDRYKESNLILRGQGPSGQGETTVAVPISSNSDDLIQLTRPHGLKTLTGYTIAYNPSEITSSGRQSPSDPIIREWNRGKGFTERYVLVSLDREGVTGELLTRVFPTQDERVQPAVGFVFNAKGASKFGRLTGQHLPEEEGQFKYRLAVILDELVRSAPSINSEIRDSGIIEGVRPDEVSYLIEILNSGSLPASINPVPLLEQKVGPTLGRDTIDKGVWAIGLSMIIVPIFMIGYYRLAGVISVIALVLNMLFLVASMALTNSSFTLPGLAGLALTIGMAVDANVLVFERMREEKERGASLIQQIRNGYDRAWITIIDSHITIFLSGAVLWAVGTEEVKGFALTLIIGMIWNLFTAVYVTRFLIEFLYQHNLIKDLHFLKAFGKTNIDFISPRRFFMAVSSIVILTGLALFFAKGQKVYNIDFTGGTLVSLRLDTKAKVDGKAIDSLSVSDRSAYVRDKASEVLPDVSVEVLNLLGDNTNNRFNIRTTEPNAKKVQEAVRQAFGSSLDIMHMTTSDPVPIPGAAADAAKPAAAKAADTAKADTAKAAAKVDETPSIGNRFAGGTSYTLSFNRKIEAGTVRDVFLRLLQADGVSTPRNHFEVIVPAEAADAKAGGTTLVLNTELDPAKVKGYLQSLSNSLSADPALLFDRLENFGGAVAGETRNLAIVAIVASWLIIIAYLWFRFKSFTYGVAAVIALVHDVLITMGAVALTHYLPIFPSPYKIDLPMIAGFLTLIGFSVNDTIVIFDRIRELKGKNADLTGNMINAAINQTLSRTFLTSLTAWLVVVIFYAFGGEGLRGFSYCLVIGFLSGVYSTIYIAAPILIEWVGGKHALEVTKAQPAATANS